MECVIHVALSPVVKGENFGPRRRRKVPRYLANPSQRMHSHHSHSGQFCSHADPKSTLRNVIQEASKLGFTHFGLSEHVPRETMDQLYPEEIEKGLDPQKLQDIFVGYLKEARELQGEHLEENGIKILVGAETENVRTKEEDVEGKRSNSLGYLIGILEGLREQNTSSDEISSDPEEKREISEPLPEEVGKGVVDYLVGSVHHVHGIPIDFDKSMLEEAVSTFGTADVGSPSGKESRRVVYHNMVSAYLDAQYEVLQRLRPEVIGHLDLPFLFDPSSTWTSSHLEDSTRSSTTLRGGKDEVLETSTTNSGTEAEELSWRKLKRNVKFACSYGALFEINGAAFRKGWETAYPSTSPLKLILSLGGRVCLSDDSHGTAQVGLNYLRSRNYLKQNNIKSVWYLERRGSSVDGSNSTGREDLEKERNQREESSEPGRGAPTSFSRGTTAIEMKDWDGNAFWRELEGRRRGN